MPKFKIVLNGDNNDRIEMESGSELVYLLEQPITTTTTTTTIPIENVNYGYLYNAYVVDSTNLIANTGWSVPPWEELYALENYVGQPNAKDIREVGTIYWNDNADATNITKFNARGSGTRFSGFGAIKDSFYIWGSRYNATYMGVLHNRNTIEVGQIKSAIIESDNAGFAIRLLKDTTVLSDGETGTYEGNNGKIYRTICIGTQEWVADNLKETKYRNGDWITGFDGGTYTPISNVVWTALTTEAMCVYNDDENNA